MKFTILSSKTVPIPSLGKEKKILGLQNELGAMMEADVWNDFPNFNQLVAGDEVEGTIAPAKDPRYNPTLRAEKAVRIYSKPNSFSAAQDKKIEGIAKAQENKDMGIRVSAAFRDATLILTTAYADEVIKRPVEERGEFIKKIHAEVRKWYMEEWENEKGNLDAPNNIPF